MPNEESDRPKRLFPTQGEQAARIAYAVLDDAQDALNYAMQTAEDAECYSLHGDLEIVHTEVSRLRMVVRHLIGVEVADKIGAAVSDKSEGSDKWLDEITSF